jgi:glucosamine--fructose-6-phosphate aminotransferase (isomerizing)
MCGIVGYIGGKDAVPILMEGLSRLEYRGYDSAGIAVLEEGRVAVRKAKGRLSHLGELLATSPVSGNTGIGHTRWATHGSPAT